MKVTINEGTSFLISNEYGDSFGKESGLYDHDTRFLSKFKLRLNCCNPVILGSRNIDHYSSTHYLTNLTCDNLSKNSLTIKRTRFVGRGLHEDIDVTNHLNREIEFVLVMELDSDFADIFEVKQQKLRKRKVNRQVLQKENSLEFSYKKPKFIRKTLIKFSSFGSKPKLTTNQAVFNIKIAPKKTWHTCIDVSPSLTDIYKKPLYRCKAFGIYRPEIDKEVGQYLKRAPYLESNNHLFERAFGRAKRDLAALAMRVASKNGSVLVTAAGIPWFVTLFGRDSIIAGLQSLILTPTFARGALLSLASRQGKEVNEFNHEQPGAIVHEVRFGELAIMREVPHALFYATIDATPLFLMLLGEYFNWTGDLKLIRSLKPNIEAALKWIDEYGDIDGDGYVEYKKESISWKDSYNSIVFNNGEVAQPPIAVSEVQAYVYAAKMAVADIYKHLGDEKRSLELKKQAMDLKRRFNEDFWLSGKQYYALALDGNKRKVDSIASNAGHLLYCGIVPQKRAKAVVGHLMHSSMFSGWGVRTLSTEAAAYNPVSYHNGSVWPHDNAIIAAGLKKYGFLKEANTIIEALIEATQYFEGNRLPELFCGYERNNFSFPVDYPVSSSPQAWASSSISFFLLTLLGLEPKAHDGKLILRPSLLSNMNYLGIHGILIGSNVINIHVKKEDGRIQTDLQIARGKLNFEIR